MSKKLPRAFDILGNIAIVRFSKEFKLKDKKKFAQDLLKKQKSIKTVLEKKGKVKGRLRKQETKHLFGERTKEVLYKENNCVFRFNIDSTYFSPRLSNERKEIASKIKKNENVLVMFSGVGPYSIVIAKNSKAKKIFSVEINREANKYAKLNVELNKVKDKVELIQGDIKRIVELLSLVPPSSSPTTPPKTINTKKIKGLLINKNRVSDNERAIPNKFDVIIMPRPRLKDSFLKEALMLSKKGTRIYYYDFCEQDEFNSIVEKIKKEANKFKKKIKILNIKKAGEIAPYKFRVRIDFKIL